MYISEKEQLFKVYNQVMDEDLAKQIKDIGDSHTSNQCAKRWNLVRELSGKSSSKSSQISGGSVEERNN